MRISIIGSGAMGCRFGVAFYDAGAEVWLYDIWQQHVENINSKGLIIEDGFGGERIVKLKAATDIEKIPLSDVVVVFTKSMYTRDAIIKALPLIGEKTVIVTLQNGLGNIEAIKDITGGKPIIAGVTNYASDLLESGKVELKGKGLTKIMALDEDAKDKVHLINDMLNKVGHNTVISNDVLVDKWEKVAFNAALNTTTAITGLSVGKIGSTPKSKKLLFDIASEVIAIANASGVIASEKHVHEVIESVLDPKMSGDHKTSMLQDRLMKRRTEIDAVCGRAIAIGKEYGISAPKLECVYSLIRIIEANYESICF